MEGQFQSLKRVFREKFPYYYGKSRYFKNYLLKRNIKLAKIADIIINDMNITRNDIVMVHTSLQYINLVDSQPEDLIYLLKMIIGSRGTLLMPTFARNHYTVLNSELPYNIRNAFCSTGLINEVFRQMPDTIQSCHPLKSVAAWGRMANYFTEDHYKSEFAFDQNSPFYKLFLLKAKIIGIGVPLEYFSFLHTVDDTNDKYFPKRYSEPIKKEIIDSNGEKKFGYYRYNLPEVVKQTSPYRISKYFEEDEMREFKKSGVPFFWANAEKVYDKTLYLAKKGITIYK